MQPKTFPFPVVSPVSLDYQSSVKYECKISIKDSTITVTHQISDGNIIADSLRRGNAKFGCMVSLPATMYRKLHTDDNKLLEVVQNIKYESGKNDMQYPMLRPVIIMTEDIPIENPDKAQGFNDIWLEKKINFPKGGIIGFDDWFIFEHAVHGMFSLKPDNNIEYGIIKVEPSEDEGFRFNVQVHTSFLTFMQCQNGEQNHIDSIWTHVLSSALVILATQYKEKEKWEQYINLKSLTQYLQNKNQPHWSEDDFYPEEVATSLYPHIPLTNRHDSDDI